MALDIYLVCTRVLHLFFSRYKYYLELFNVQYILMNIGLLHFVRPHSLLTQATIGVVWKITTLGQDDVKT